MYFQGSNRVTVRVRVRYFVVTRGHKWVLCVGSVVEGGSRGSASGLWGLGFGLGLGFRLGP